MEILKPSDLRERFRDPRISPYRKVITMVDGDLVEIVEYHPCVSGSEWMIYQYSRSSKLIESARRTVTDTPTLQGPVKLPWNLKLV